MKRLERQTEGCGPDGVQLLERLPPAEDRYRDPPRPVHGEQRYHRAGLGALQAGRRGLPVHCVAGGGGAPLYTPLRAPRLRARLPYLNRDRRRRRSARPVRHRETGVGRAGSVGPGRRGRRLREYLKCGILVYGFASVSCATSPAPTAKRSSTRRWIRPGRTARPFGPERLLVRRKAVCAGATLTTS